MLKTFKEMCDDESICSYCEPTEYGEHMEGVSPNGYWSCEGSFCKEAYAYYLDNEEITERAANISKKVKITIERNK